MLLLKRLINSISALFLASTAAQGADANAAPLSDEQIILALSELTQRDTTALEAARNMIAGQVSEDEVFAYYAQDYPNLAALGHGLWTAQRLLDVDWAEGLDDVTPQFEMILNSAGINWPQDIDSAIEAQLVSGTLHRGDAVGMVYALLWLHVRAAGYRFMSLNTDSDAHMMFLAPDAAALRWQSVQIGPNMYFEIADWQFTKQMQAAGHPIEFPKHPSANPQMPPRP